MKALTLVKYLICFTQNILYRYKAMMVYQEKFLTIFNNLNLLIARIEH